MDSFFYMGFLTIVYIAIAAIEKLDNIVQIYLIKEVLFLILHTYSILQLQITVIRIKRFNNHLFHFISFHHILCGIHFHHKKTT